MTLDNRFNQEPNPIDPEYRGYICSRILSSKLPPITTDEYVSLLAKHQLKDSDPLGGELEYLCLDPKELHGKVLDVGIGGGRSIIQGLENHIDIYGIDLALKARQGALHPGGMSVAREQVARQCLTNVLKTYPDRVIEADAAVRIPFPDIFFNTTIACISLPNYARNRREAITSIVEMIRVANERVVFTAGQRNKPNNKLVFRYGVGRNIFNFQLINFLDELGKYGIRYEWKSVNDRSEHEPIDIVSAHLDVSSKNQGLLTKKIPDFLNSEEYVNRF